MREYYSPRERLLFAMWFYPTRAVRLIQYLVRGDLPGARAILSGAVAR